MRALLIAAGAAVAAYGGWLLRPQLPTAAAWLIGGPVLHDAIVAPAVGVTGLVIARLFRAAPLWRAVVATGLAVTATLLLMAVPLIWRPHAAPPNPGLQDRNYGLQLAVWLAVCWGALIVAALVSRVVRRRRRADGPLPSPVSGDR